MKKRRKPKKQTEEKKNHTKPNKATAADEILPRASVQRTKTNKSTGPTTMRGEKGTHEL